MLALILLSYFGSKVQCGIPLQRWMMIYFLIVSMKSLVNLLKIPLVRSQSSYQGAYSLIAFLIVDGVYLAWLIYGNLLFYSKENNCETMEGSQNMNRLMLLTLIIGYFQMAVYLMLIILIPVLIIASRNQRNPN